MSPTTPTMSYGWFVDSGMIVVSASSVRSALSIGVKNGGTSMLFWGRKDRR